MKNTVFPVLLKKNKFYLWFAVGIFVALLLCINFHTDGSSITPGNYLIYKASSLRELLDFDANSPAQVCLVERTPDTVALQKHFSFVHLSDKKYLIEDRAGSRLTLQDNLMILASPSAKNPESQQWEIRRWRNSLYFTITNVESGLTLYAEGAGALQCYDYVDDTSGFLFGFTPEP